MLHITLNTGHVMRHTEPVSEAAIMTVGPLLVTGGPIPGFAAFHVTVGRGPGAITIAVFRGRDPITLSAACWSTEASQPSWAALEEVYLTLSDRDPAILAADAAPQMPTEIPWLATLILPGLALQTRENIGWLADFNHVMAEAARRASR